MELDGEAFISCSRICGIILHFGQKLSETAFCLILLKIKD